MSDPNAFETRSRRSAYVIFALIGLALTDVSRLSLDVMERRHS